MRERSGLEGTVDVRSGTARGSLRAALCREVAGAVHGRDLSYPAGAATVSH